MSKGGPTEIDRYSSRLAASSTLLSVRVYCRCDQDNTSGRWLDRVIIRFKGLARNNVIDVWVKHEFPQDGRENQ